jgi:hypothetical protein
MNYFSSFVSLSGFDLGAASTRVPLVRRAVRLCAVSA